MSTLPKMLASILRAVRSWLPVVDAAPEVTIVPTETWLRMHERLRAAERALPARTRRRYRRVRDRGDA